MIRTYDADDPEADLPLTEAEQEALDEADRLREARREPGPGRRVRALAVDAREAEPRSRRAKGM